MKFIVHWGKLTHEVYVSPEQSVLEVVQASTGELRPIQAFDNSGVRLPPEMSLSRLAFKEGDAIHASVDELTWYKHRAEKAETELSALKSNYHEKARKIVEALRCAIPDEAVFGDLTEGIVAHILEES